MAFKDHFSVVAAEYSRFRPRYPSALFDFLSRQAPSTCRAWDCATGSGQAAVGLADFFDHVIATDASAAQVEQATPKPRVEYRVATAEDSGLEASSVDLVTVAQAIHWFDLEKFYAEVRRVGRPGACLALWGYFLLSCNPEIDALIDVYYRDTLGPYWPPERRIVERRYRDLAFPFEEISSPEFFMESDWSLDELVGYLSTWSALKKYRESTGLDPLPAFRESLLEKWGPASERKRMHWPVFLRLGRLQG